MGLFIRRNIEAVKKRVIVYVDGFNFYYGLKYNAWRRYYWLDMVSLFERFMREDQELVKVKYFSAKPNDINKSRRQNAFFQANQNNPKFELVLGKYLHKAITCRNCGYVINTYEEKETDVRIATQIVADAFKKQCDIAIIVSADSDMVPSIELAQESGVQTFVYFPPNHYSSNLASLCNNRPICLSRYESRFRQSLFPDSITLSSNGFVLNIPERWKAMQV